MQEEEEIKAQLTLAGVSVLKDYRVRERRQSGEGTNSDESRKKRVSTDIQQDGFARGQPLNH
ncbi:hypothetical protein ABHI18_004365 [Aspergillus niger]